MPVDNQVVQQIFTRAISIADPQERQAFLIEQCRGDEELERRVSELLAAFEQPKPYFDQPTEMLTAALPQVASAANRPFGGQAPSPGSLLAVAINCSR